MSIEDRPVSVNRREEFGHWEIETVVCTRESSAVLLTLDERTTRFRHIIKIPSRSAQAVEQGFQQLRATYGERFSSVFRSITSDNGSEFASLPKLCPDVPIYYAHPYAASMRSRIRSSAASFLKAALWTTSLLMLFSEYRTGSTVSRVNLSIMPPPLTFSRLSYLILQFRVEKLAVKLL